MSGGGTETKPVAESKKRRDVPRPQPVRGPEQPPGEVNGPRGPEPTRFGDWERSGRCSDF
jgi:hypothetical protein